MALYDSEAVALFATATHPFSKEPITNLTATAHVWHVDTHGDPRKDAEVRSSPGFGPYTLTYDEDLEGYVGFFPPDAERSPGSYVYRIQFVGGAWDNVEYGNFKTKA